MAATVDDLAQAGYAVERINIDKQPELARRYGVRAIPCCIIVERGREIDRVTGVTTIERLTLKLAAKNERGVNGLVPHPAWRYERPTGYRAAVVQILCYAQCPRARPVPCSRSAPSAAASWCVGTTASSC